MKRDSYNRDKIQATHSTTRMSKMSSGTSMRLWKIMMMKSFHPCFRLRTGSKISFNIFQGRKVLPLTQNIHI